MSLPEDFEAAIKPSHEASPDAFAFAFRDRRLLVHLLIEAWIRDRRE